MPDREGLLRRIRGEKGWPWFGRDDPGTRPEDQDRRIFPLPPGPVAGQDQYDDADPNDRYNT